MRGIRTSAGFTLIELLVSLALMSMVIVGMAGMLIENSKISKSHQMRARIQSSARTTHAFVVQQLRTAGWDPTAAGIAPVVLDPNLADAINTIDLQVDLNADGDTADVGETITIRHNGNLVEWRSTAGGAFETVGVDITNDADGDGVPELMFTPDVTPNPGRLTVTVTAGSDGVDPTTREPIRYTVSSDVLLRNAN